MSRSSLPSPFLNGKSWKIGWAMLTMLMLGACATFQNAGDTAGFGRGTDISEIEQYVESFPAINVNSIAKKSFKDVFNVGDTAEISVYQVEDLSGEFVVDREGNLNLPLLGTVPTSGLSTLELQEVLTRKYGADYLQNPSIDVKIEAQELGSIIVDGAVERPGVFEIDEVVTLLEALALAQGISEDSNGTKIYIMRNVEGERKVGLVNIREVRNQTREDPQIIPNDVVFVENSASRILFREFLRTLPLINTAVIFGTR